MEHSKRFTQTTRGKLILAFALVLCVSLFTWIVNRSAFDRINTVVEDLARPNGRLTALNRFQMGMNRLNDFYRAEALQDRYRPSSAYTEKVAEVSTQLLQLKDSFASDPDQLLRLDQVDSIFHQRNELFEKYLKIRYNYIHSGLVDEQFEELAIQVDRENLKVDTNVVTTEKQTKTYTYYDPVVKEEKPARKRLFRRKKQAVVETKPYVVVEEKLNVHIDTLAVSKKKDSILENIRISLDEVEKERNVGRRFLQKQELILIGSNEILLNRVLELIGQVEQEERFNAEENALTSIRIARETIAFTKVLTVIFVLAAFGLIVLIIGDITKFNRYRKQLEASRAEAEFHSQAKQRFLSNMSHEIRSPLQTIVGYSELMLQEAQYDPSKVEAVSKASEHLLQVVNEILDYSRIVSDKFNMEKKPFLFSEVIREVSDLAAFQCQQKGIDWVLRVDNVPANEPLVLSDAFRIRQILINVLSNAVKFTREGQVMMSVKVKEQASSVAASITISDTGAGMSAGDLKLIFQQFERAGNTEAEAGTGLGLSIVKELMDVLKGKISVSSELGKGTSFRLDFAFEKASKITRESVSVAPDPDFSFDGVIWVVDDDVFILKLCEQLLLKKNIGYRCFNNPAELLNVPWDDRVKILFADVRMPGMNGMELCRKLRESGHEQVKIIALTAQVLPDEKELFLESGFDGVVLKPFKSEEFYETIRSFSEPLFDFSELRKMIPDEPDFREILAQFVSDSSADLELLRAVLKPENTNEALLLTHRLAGRFGQMGARSLAQRLRELEIRLKSANPGLVFDEISEVIPELENAIRQLKPGS